MKVKVEPQLHPIRGGPVKVGNVYSNSHGRFFKIVVGIVTGHPTRPSAPWKNIVTIHVDIDGRIVGASCMPRIYVENHQDLVGLIKRMPSMKIEWIREDTAKRDKPKRKSS